MEVGHQASMARVQQSRGAVREQAVRLLLEARRIFIIYSNKDLERARDLKRRIVRLRADKPDDSVFLAVESLPVGEDVSRARVQSELAEADLAVVVCGENTAARTHVADEVQQALQQRESKGMKILPVILKAGVTLPAGLDYSVHAIHYTVLFPAIKWMRLALAGTLALLIAIAGFLAWRNRVAEIQRQIDRDVESQSSPLDLQRVSRLTDLRASAMWVGFLDGMRQIDHKLDRSGRESLRLEWLPQDRQRIAFLADPSDNVIWVGYEKRIDALDAATREVVRSYDLTSFEVGEYRPDPIQTGPPRPAEKPQPRHPARLLELQVDPRVRGVLAKVEYERYAQPSTSGSDDEVRGGEKEVLRLAKDLERPESVGLSDTIGWYSPKTPDRLDYGVGYVDLLDTSEAVEETLSSLAGDDLKKVETATGATDPDDRIYRLARDPLGPGSLIGLEIRADKRLPSWFRNGESRRDYLVGVLVPGQDFLQVGPTTLYDDNARDLNAIAREAQAIEGGDPSTTEESEFSAVAPTYEPAALWAKGKLAWIGQGLVSFGAERPDLLKNAIPEGARVTHVRWLANGAVRFVLKDGSLSVCPAGTGECHRFLRPSWARAIDLMPDGGQVLILDAEGRIQAWQMKAFGPDGWIRPTPGSP